MKFLHHKLIVLAVIILFGFLLRVVDVAQNPPGLTWDEAAIGYNAWSILGTGADEYGTPFPLSFRSFDDYKPPAYIYFTVPFVALFGMNEFSVRIVSVVAGTLLIGAIFLLVEEVIGRKKKKKYPDTVYEIQYTKYLPLASAFFIAISPWSIQHSRGAFEGNLGICFLIFGIFFLLRGLSSYKFMLSAVLMFILAMYSYHSFRLVVPLFLFLFACLYWRALWEKKALVATSIVLGAILVMPIGMSLFTGSETGARLDMVSQYADPELLSRSIERLEYARETGDVIGEIINNRRVQYTLITLDGYLDHYDPEYLFIYGDWGKHHHAFNMGVVYIVELPLLLFGLVALFKKPSREIIALIALLLIAPIPSAITTGTPHAIRSIAMMPVLHIISAAGLVSLVHSLLRQKNSVKYAGLTIIMSLIVLNVIYYLHQYFVETPVEYADFWQSENDTLYRYLSSVEDEYDRIVVTYWYGEPYIYYLFYNRIDPAWYQKYWQEEGKNHYGLLTRNIGKYEFRKIQFEQDRQLHNTLLVGAPGEIPEEASRYDVTLPNGDVMYRMYQTDSL